MKIKLIITLLYITIILNIFGRPRNQGKHKKKRCHLTFNQNSCYKYFSCTYVFPYISQTPIFL
jgi:hypothetical protein